MHMKWITVDNIVQELQLKSPQDDYEALKKELRIRLATLHPDKTNGTFPSQKDKEDYDRIASAYEFIKQISRESCALVPVTQLPAIIKAVRDAQVTTTETHIPQLRTECRNESQTAIRNRFIMPRISSGVFATICAFLFTFGSSLPQHPVLGRIAENTASQMVLLVLAAYSALFFLFTWWRERIEVSKIEWLMSEAGRKHMFEKLLDDTFDLSMVSESTRFTLQNVIKIIQGGKSHQYNSPLIMLSVFLKASIPTNAAEKVAEIHLLELEKRGAIHRIADPSIDSVYEFDERVIMNRRDRG